VIPLRPAVETDLGLIFSSWLKSYWATRPPEMTAVASGLYFSDQGHHGVIERILGRTGAIVAHVPDDPDTIMGWACIEDDCLHYVYVREIWRRKGVAKALVGAVPVATVSHLTPEIARLGAFRYDPYRR